MIAFRCTACREKVSARNERAGKKIKCPACGALATVPASTAEPMQDLPTLPPTKANGPPEQVTQPPSEAPDGGHTSLLTEFLAPPQAAGELGRLGGFRILKILGHGGMGVVFQGEDPRLGRQVAIKALLPHLAGSTSSQQRFLREARAAATLEHDHIVPILQVGEERGAPFIVMPLLKGESLEDRLRRDAALPLPEVLRIGRETAEGLAAAHEKKLIHRDIKPANLWLEAPRGRVKILDFGLARPVAQESCLTQHGAVIGTPAYMAPEQGGGQAVDTRCDLFSLGVVLYRLCTGQLPFHGSDTGPPDESRSGRWQMTEGEWLEKIMRAEPRRRGTMICSCPTAAEAEHGERNRADDPGQLRLAGPGPGPGRGAGR